MWIIWQSESKLSRVVKWWRMKIWWSFNKRMTRSVKRWTELSLSFTRYTINTQITHNFANELKWKSTWTIKMEIEKLGWNIQRTAIWKIMKWNEVTSMKWIKPHEQSPMNKAPWIRPNELNKRTREKRKKRIQLTRLEFEDDEVLFEDILLGRPRQHTKIRVGCGNESRCSAWDGTVRVTMILLASWSRVDLKENKQL